MDWLSFDLLVYDNLTLYLGILACSLLMYCFIFRKTYISFLDPLIFNLLYSVFGFSVVIFLYATQNIEPRYLYSYLFTQAAFFAGLFVFKQVNKDSLSAVKNINRPFEHEAVFIKILFVVTSAIYAVVQLLSYKLVGIPLFMISRTGAYADTGGLGIMQHIIDVLRPATIFMLIYLLFKPGKGLLLKIYLAVFSALLLLFFALSGSKSVFMTVGFVLFIYLILNAAELRQNFLNLRKYEKYILLAGLSFVFFTILIQLNNDTATEDSSINIFLYRLVASGDTYYFAYPNNTIETINGSKGFLALFGDIFSILRVVPRESQPDILGVQLFQVYYDSDLIAGPNARHNVFGYVYYGFYGSIVFSFAIGLFLGFIRNKLIFLFRRNVLGQIAFMFLYVNATFIETDPPVAVSGLEEALVIFPIFIIPAMMLYIMIYKLRLQYKNDFYQPLPA